MNEQERADWLARAIEDLVHGDPPPDAPDALDDDEIRSLMRIARARLEAAQESAHAGVQHEGAVWHQVLARLEGRRPPLDAGLDMEMSSAINAGDLAVVDDPEDAEAQELRDIVAMRRQMSEDLLSLAETHREAVWQKVQARLQAAPAARRKGLFSFLRRTQADADALAPSLDAVAGGEPAWSADPRVDDLLRLARSRKTLSRMAAEASAGPQDRVWARIRPGLSAHLFGGTPVRHDAPPASRHLWPRLAMVGATVALVVAALGPIPATGLANHPVTRFVNFVGNHIGVTETSSSPPAGAGDPLVVNGTEVSARNAAALMLLPVQEPGVVPAGMRLESSEYFPKPLTAGSGGMYVLTYAGEDGAVLTVFQEAASGAGIAVLRGSATDIVLADGTPATYFEGSWQTSDGAFTWDQADSHTLVFERAGVRTIIRHTGGSAGAATLAAVANGMTPASTAAGQ